jgi:hypothetical protein
LADSLIESEVFARNNRRQLSQLTARDLQACYNFKKPNTISSQVVFGNTQRGRSHVTCPPINALLGTFDAVLSKLSILRDLPETGGSFECG